MVQNGVLTECPSLHGAWMVSINVKEDTWILWPKLNQSEKKEVHCPCLELAVWRGKFRKLILEQLDNMQEEVLEDGLPLGI